MRPLALCFFMALASLSNAQSASQTLVNRKAPEIARLDLSGKSVTLASLRGRVVLLNFWATWCVPCQVEMPVFEAWQRKYGAQGLAILGVSMDDEESPVRRIVQKLKISYPIAMGDAALGRSYGDVLGLPLTFLIDRNGVVRAQFQGEADLKKIESSLQELLNAR
jgi:thiol-disulfide isomerase/thioredoxin